MATPIPVNRRFISECNRWGEFGERLIHTHAEALFGEPLVRTHRRGSAIDLEGPTLLLEVKTVRLGHELKLRGSGASTRAKATHAAQTGKRALSVLVIVDEARHRCYVHTRSGFGAYRARGMISVATYPVDPAQVAALIQEEP